MSEQETPKRSGWLSQLPPALVTVVIFVVIFLRIPFDRFTEAVAAARLLPFLVLMGAFSLCFFAVDTFVLSRLVRWFHGPLPYRDLLPVRATTYLVSIINTQLAQGALILYIHRRFLTPLGEITGTIAMMILLEVTQLTIFATLGLLSWPTGLPRSLLLAPVVIALVWVAVVGLSRSRLSLFGRRLDANPILRTFRRVRLWQALVILGLKGPVFVLSLFVHWHALTLFGIDIPLLQLLACLPIVYFVGALPVTVAHLGTTQAAWIFFFNDYAAEADLLAYSLASHLTFMLANGTLGLFFLPKAWADLFVHKRQEDIQAESD